MIIRCHKPVRLKCSVARFKISFSLTFRPTMKAFKFFFLFPYLTPKNSEGILYFRMTLILYLSNPCLGQATSRYK